MYIIKNNRTYK